MQKSAFLYLTNTLNKSIISEYNALNKVVQKQDRVSFLYDCSDKLPDEQKDFHYHNFRFEDLKQHGLPLYNEHSIVPGNTHLPLVDFYLKYPDYKYYWVIENDVRFAGNWKKFFATFSSYTEDFLTTHIRWYHEEPQWPRWELKHPEKEIKTSQRLRSFNPMYRISNEALAYLIDELRTGWWGHYEVTFPTLIYHSQYKLMDLGGDSVFTPDALRYRMYTSKTKDKKNLNYGTFRFRPPYYLYGLKRNHLYHPVKPWKAFVKHYRERVKTYI
jgi:hypothetical protein